MTVSWRQKAAKHKTAILIICILMCVILIVSALLLHGRGSAEVSYRETQVRYGDLVVGITESGSVDIGTVDQTFELDMSALQRTDTTSAGSGSGSSNGNSTGSGGAMSQGGMGGSMGGGMTGGLDVFDQIFSRAESNSYTSSGEDSKLTVKEVCVSVGQQVQAGDVLYRLEEESVSKLEEQLKSNVDKAKADLDAIYADQTLSRQTAQYTYDSSIAYGDYASTEYTASVETLEETQEQKQTALEQAQKALEEYKGQLDEITRDYEAAEKVLEELEWTCNHLDKWEEPYEYVTNCRLEQTASSNVDSLKQKKEQLEKNVEQAEKNVETCTQELNAASRSLEQGKLSADQTRSLRELAYSTAREAYDLAIAYLEEDAADQEEIYEEAQSKWKEFSSHISNNAVCAKYSGVITSVDLEEGDSIHTNDTLVTLYDLNEVTITVPVDENDMKDISLGTQANISFTAYPDESFQAAVTEISDASTDSSGNVTYQVTATLQGDTSGLFQGMTGDVTFITKETREVLYVSNRAIIREGTKSYVKLRDESGKIRRQEVVTGFSDGINVEIREGLSRDDTVLIESKVESD